MKRQAFVLAVVALLSALTVGAGRAHAAGGTYRIVADGNPIIGWSPRSGAIDQTSDDKVHAVGTLVGDNGSAPYDVAAGPGVVRTKLSGTFSGPAGFSNPFAPGTQAVSTTELTVSGPDDRFINATVNLHVDGFLDTPVCSFTTSCGALNVHIGTFPFGHVSEFDTLPETRANEFGLAFDPVPGGYHVHGDVLGTSEIGFRTNNPTPITIVISLSGGFGAGPGVSTFGGNFNDPDQKLQVSFAPSGPVLNDIPAGYTVSGPSVVNNHWTDPFAPPSGDVVITSCAQLAQPTVVHGNLVIRNLTGCPSIALPNLTRVDGDLIIEGTDASSIVIGPGASVGGAIDVSGNSGDLTIDQSTVGGAIDASGTGGDLTIDQSTVGGAIDVSGTGGDLTIDDNSVGEAIDVGGGVGGDLTITDNGVDVVDGDADVSGDLTITDNGSAVVSVGNGQVGGDLTIETGGDSFSGTTAGGSTSVTILNATANMHVFLPKEAFAQPVGFTLSRTSDTPPEAGTAADGSPAQIDPILGYRFAFAIPTLNKDASLTFVVDLSQLDAVGRADLLNAIGAGIGTIAVKGDAPDAQFHAFAQCVGAQTPAANGCVAVTLLNASGVPAGPTEQPAFARFEGAAGHFSTYAIVRVLKLDTTPPVITVPTNVAVDATSPKGAQVSYSASAKDDHDASPTLACTPASGSVFPIGDITVTCKATDAAGNSATARFVVHVRGASEQIVRLVDKTLTFLDLPTLKPALKAGLQSVADAILAKNPRAACKALDLYVAAVKLAPARAFTTAERSELLADAARIKTVIGC
jgi:HYR domain-containing protein